MKPSVQTLHLSKIQEPPAPLRIAIDMEKLRELAGSLKEHGQLQPIIVETTARGWQIIAGHRRYLAAQLLGWKFIEAKVRESNRIDQSVISLAENIHREPLTPLEEARVAQVLVVDQQLDVDIVARRFGKTRQWVDRRLEMLDWPPDLLEAIHAGDLSLAVAKEFTRVKDEAYRKYLTDNAKNNGASSLTARIWADEWTATLATTGHAPTALASPTPPYSGQTVGVACAGCDVMLPVAQLTTVYLCRNCVAPEPAKAGGPAHVVS